MWATSRLHRCRVSMRESTWLNRANPRSGRLQAPASGTIPMDIFVRTRRGRETAERRRPRQPHLCVGGREGARPTRVFPKDAHGRRERQTGVTRRCANPGRSSVGERTVVGHPATVGGASLGGGWGEGVWAQSFYFTVLNFVF